MRDERKKFIAIPESSKLDVEVCIFPERKYIRRVAIIAPVKADIGRPQIPGISTINPVTAPKATPKAAPDEIPSMKGSDMGFRKIA